MDALSLLPVSPVALVAPSALRPVQALAIPASQSGSSARATTLSTQDLAQALFQRALQAATLSPLVAPATGTASLVQEATASLLTSLAPPQAAADTTAVASATTNPASVQGADTTSSTAAPSAPPAPVLQELPAAQDALATSLSPDFAMQTALRFGAGVVSPALTALPAADLGAALVRDAASVQRLGNLQPRAGGPGPEAFAYAQSAPQRTLRTYEAASLSRASQGPMAVDLFA